MRGFLDDGARLCPPDFHHFLEPTFHSGGGSPNDPVGTPGEPIAIIDPDGAIGGAVMSPNNVAARLNLNVPDEPFNQAFIEVIFPMAADLQESRIRRQGASL